MKLILLWFLLSPLSATASERTLHIYAASSLTNALNRIAKNYKPNVNLSFQFAGTSKLAKQIQSGAPADIFFAADSHWMDHLEKQGLILIGTRKNILSNRIVIVSNKKKSLTNLMPADLTSHQIERVALASESVPAGRYSRQVLKNYQVLSSDFEKKIVNADSARIALKWVATGEVQAGLVYETDARSEARVYSTFKFPSKSHEAIVYPLSVLNVSKNQEDARSFVDFLQTAESRQIFSEEGFELL